MSAQELKNFEAQLALLSYAERLAIIEYLAKSLQPAYNEEKEALALGFSGGAVERRKVDEAITEFEHGEFDTYDNFDDFLVEIADESFGSEISRSQSARQLQRLSRVSYPS